MNQHQIINTDDGSNPLLMQHQLQPKRDKATTFISDTTEDLDLV